MDGRGTAFQDHQAQKDVLLWTRAYRSAVLAALILLIFCVGYAVNASCKPTCIGEPERINPNTAGIASLVRLPGIGRARAMDIIHFRQTKADKEQVFNTVHDLEQIRGIGPKTAKKMKLCLIFKEDTAH